MANRLKKKVARIEKVDSSKEKRKDRRLIFGIFVILIIQGVFIIYLAYVMFYVVPYNENQLKKELNLSRYQLSRRIDLVNKEFDSKINEISKNLLQTQKDLGEQIGVIKAMTSSDFSNIIQSAIRSVVFIRTDVGQGSGFIITTDGYMVTNAHVLAGATYGEAVTFDLKSKDIKMVGYNLTTDIALLKIDGSYDYLRLRNSDEIKVGEKVIAIGNPLGLSFSVSEGIVSAVNRKGINGLNAYIQTDAALNPGNSGGPLIGVDGTVIGINNFKAYGENLGFALESNYIKDSVNQITLNKMNKTIIDY